MELLKGYHDARRQFVEKTFARHTHRAQLARIRAKILLGGCAGHTRAASSLERYRPNQLSRKEAIISFKSGEKPDNLYGVPTTTTGTILHRTMTTPMRNIS